MIVKRLGELFALITLCCMFAAPFLPSANATEPTEPIVIVAPESVSEADVAIPATEPPVVTENPVQSDTERSKLYKAKQWVADKYHKAVDKYHAVKDKFFNKE